MLTFDDCFASDGFLNCLLWADEPKFNRVRFNINSAILRDVLLGGNPVHDKQNLELCERHLSQIEAACRGHLRADRARISSFCRSILPVS
jgi:hypothetical protein